MPVLNLFQGLISNRQFTVMTYKSQPDYAGWSKPGRAVAREEWRPGALFPNVGFIVTTMSSKAQEKVSRLIC